MEAVAVVEGDTKTPSAAAPSGKRPVIVTEILETPSSRAAAEHKRRSAIGVRPSTQNEPLEQLNNSTDAANSNNPLLKEDERLDNSEATQLLVAVLVTTAVIGGYFAWKWGWLSASAKPK